MATGDAVTHLAYPREIPFLAPSQEWRTMWDSAIERTRYDRSHPEGPLQSRFEAILDYEDSKGKAFQSRSVVDWDILMKMHRVSTKTTHDIAETLEQEFERANGQLTAIATTLDGYTANEHKGIWTYPADPAAERTAREAEEQAQAERRQRGSARARAIGEQIRRGIDGPTEDSSPADSGDSEQRQA